MGIRDWLFKNSRDQTFKEVACKDLFEAAQNYRLRELAFWTCVNMIANAIGKCEFRTFEKGKETKGDEYYLWNVEPNANQNSTAFLHKLIANLFRDNEVLVVEAPLSGGRKQLVVADTWQVSDDQAIKPNVYRDVIVGNYTFSKAFKESDVLHLTLNARNLYPVLNDLYQSYDALIAAAIKNYEWRSGQHWKVHVAQVAKGDPEWLANFQSVINTQFKPFINASGAVLPEFDGYSYENLGSGDTRAGDTRDIRKLYDDVFDFYARGFMIPPVLIGGDVAGTQDAVKRWLTLCIDPLCDQLQEEINRKRFGIEAWKEKTYIQVDSSKLIHFDLFEHSANIEKLVGSGFSYNDIQRSIGGVEIDEPWANEHFFTRNFDLAKNYLKGGENK